MNACIYRNDDLSSAKAAERDPSASETGHGPISAMICECKRGGHLPDAGQFFCTMQLPPAALRFEHNSVAWSAEVNGPTMARK